MNTTLRILVAALIVVLIVLAAFGCIYLDTLNTVTADLPVVLDKAIAREALETRKAAAKQIGDMRTDLNGQFTKLNRTLATLGRDVPEKAEKQLAGFRADVNEQLSTLNASMNRNLENISLPAKEAIVQARGLLPPIQNAVNVASDNATILGDCDHNPHCLANRTIGVMKSTEKMAQAGEKMADAIAKETPDTAAAVKSTSRDMSVIVGRFARPASWLKNVATTAATVLGKLLW